MKFSYTFVVLLIFQLAFKYVKASLGSKDMACENGIVVQYRSSYECKCNPDHTHENENKCVKNSDMTDKCNNQTISKVCGEFAKCATEPSSDGTYKCLCNPGFVSKELAGAGCVVAPCKNKDCGKGVCTIDNNGKALCSCHINHKNKLATDKASECVTGAEGEQTCDLPCVQNAHCQTHDDGYFFCECINKQPMVDGACSNAISSFLSPFHVLLIIGVYIVYLKIA